MLSFLKEAFRRSLKTHPILTNTTVYATFYVAADLSQQTFKRYRYRNDGLEKPEYNLKDTARLAAVGSTVYAPALYYCYRFLDNKFPGAGVRAVVTKLVADQGFMTPSLLAAFYIVNSVVEGKEDIYEEFREKYWRTYIANQIFWIPAQTINFFFLPPYLRVVYVASMSFLWINFLCYMKRQKIVARLHSKLE